MPITTANEPVYRKIFEEQIAQKNGWFGYSNEEVKEMFVLDSRGEYENQYVEAAWLGFQAAIL